ncbi:MAG: 8-amino-7-oxononanoate synthase [Firmicutes bacterium]|nr:8-amino-7-oxononanoate synthase [Bacillota bacterium]
MNFFKEELEKIKQADQDRNMTYLESAQDSKVLIDGKEYLIFGSNNYLNLSNNREIIESVKDAVDKYGYGSGGSRLTTGSYDVNRRLEEDLAKFKGTEKALVFNTGYMANVGVISAICDRKWSIFSDRINHGSIVDGIVLSGAKFKRYKHNDIEDLKKLLSEDESKYKLIVTDGVFSMDGDIAPLEEISLLAKEYEALLMIDDAHGVGVLGENGKGTVSHLGLEGKVDIQVGTLSKAFGCIGGYVAGDADMVDYVKNRAKSFIFATSNPPLNSVAVLKSLELVKNADEKRKDLLEKSAYLRRKLKEKNFDVIDGITPIIAVVVGSSKEVLRIQNSLLEEGIYVPGIRPPTVPRNTGRLRISLMSNHTYGDLDILIKKLGEIL